MQVARETASVFIAIRTTFSFRVSKDILSLNHYKDTTFVWLYTCWSFKTDSCDCNVVSHLPNTSEIPFFSPYFWGLHLVTTDVDNHVKAFVTSNTIIIIQIHPTKNFIRYKPWCELNCMENVGWKSLVLWQALQKNFFFNKDDKKCFRIFYSISDWSHWSLLISLS